MHIFKLGAVTQKKFGLFAVSNIWVKHIGLLCWLFTIYWLISTTTQTVGLKYKFQQLIGVTATDDTVVN